MGIDQVFVLTGKTFCFVSWLRAFRVAVRSQVKRTWARSQLSGRWVVEVEGAHIRFDNGLVAGEHGSWARSGSVVRWLLGGVFSVADGV